MIPPMAAEVAGAEPEMAPKKAHEMDVMQADGAGSFRNSIFIKRTSRSEIPLISISSPDSVNSGRASSGKLSMDVNIFWVMAGRAAVSPAVSMASMVASPTDTAMGVPKMRKNKSVATRTIPKNIYASPFPPGFLSSSQVSAM